MAVGLSSSDWGDPNVKSLLPSRTLNSRESPHPVISTVVASASHPIKTGQIGGNLRNQKRDLTRTVPRYLRPPRNEIEPATQESPLPAAVAVRLG